MAAYRLDVRPFLDEVGGGAHVSDVLELDELRVGTQVFAVREPARFDMTVSNAGDGIVAIGSVTAPVSTTCSRCLCHFDTEITAEVEGFWLRPGDKAPEETELSGHVDAEGAIDLEPAIVSALVVEAPFAPLHDVECAGLCARCGADLNVERCSCPVTADSNHPFAVLEGLLAENGEGNSE